MSVRHFVVGLGVGGAERTLINLLRSLPPEERVHHSVGVLHGGPLSTELDQLGVVYTEIRSPRAMFTVARSVLQNRSLCQGWMVHGNLLATYFSAFSGRRALWTVHATEFRHPIASRSTEALSRFSSVVAQLSRPNLVSCSNAALDFHRRRLHYPGNRFRTIPAGFDEDRFAFSASSRKALRSEFGFRDSEIVFGSFGRMSEQKDFPNVLEAFALASRETPSSRLVLAGRGLVDDDPKIEGMIRRSGAIRETVTLVGERGDLDRWYSALDAFVLGSSAGESFPMVIGEAMSAGTIPVVTDVGDSARMVEGVGLSVPAQNPQALAEAMCHAAKKVGNLENRRWAAGPQRVLAHYSSQAILCAWRDLYASLD